MSLDALTTYLSEEDLLAEFLSPEQVQQIRSDVGLHFGGYYGWRVTGRGYLYSDYDEPRCIGLDARLPWVGGSSHACLAAALVLAIRHDERWVEETAGRD